MVRRYTSEDNEPIIYKASPVKIKWLNDKMTEAIITKGYWWWKRFAHVYWDNVWRDGYPVWRFKQTGYEIGRDDSWELQWAKAAEEARLAYVPREGKEWVRDIGLPAAHLLKDTKQ